MRVYEYRWTRHRIAELDDVDVRSPAGAHAALAHLFAGAESERVAVLCLDTRNHPIGAEVVAAGAVAQTSVRLAELFRGAVRTNASSVILAHNHPSGSLAPSPDDLALTTEAIRAGKLLDIPVLDHLIVTDEPDGPFRSLRDAGVDFR